MTKILVVYYSHSGNTQVVARQLARVCKADLEPIIDVRPRQRTAGYLLRHRGQLRRVAYFCTYGGAGQDKVLGDMVQLCGRPALDTLALCDKDIATTRHRDALTRFAQRLKSGAPPSMRPPQAPHPVDEPLVSP